MNTRTLLAMAVGGALLGAPLALVSASDNFVDPCGPAPNATLALVMDGGEDPCDPCAPPPQSLSAPSEGGDGCCDNTDGGVGTLSAPSEGGDGCDPCAPPPTPTLTAAHDGGDRCCDNKDGDVSTFSAPEGKDDRCDPCAPHDPPGNNGGAPAATLKPKHDHGCHPPPKCDDPTDGATMTRSHDCPPPTDIPYFPSMGSLVLGVLGSAALVGLVVLRRRR